MLKWWRYHTSVGNEWRIPKEETMTRFHVLKPDEMDAEQCALLEANKAAGGRLRGGPYWAYIRNTDLMTHQMTLNDYVRDAGYTVRERQIAILVACQFWQATYPWAIQARLSEAIGLEPEIIEAIKAGEQPLLNDKGERLAYEIASTLLADKNLGDLLYLEAERHFGLDRLIDLVTCIGFYTMHSCTANAFDVMPADGAPD